ncbi:hypothetical protein DCAR_0935635 [Daucus carota subsp. sativus]|uniref:TIR domain-containing protein n=1 Tax=Daucus carota subsp. sativus TaxID=79200 RepID=A0AAF1BKG7_DAUCS|nr:hypothetical protein DCAR_0935635 [Daucus carota subsp. sativus]
MSSEWNVFLSFRGIDTRKTFTGHLFEALTRAGVRTFMDDPELRKGEEISPQLLKAIQSSEISLVIFSRNYASSRWCLDELVEILECKRRLGQSVYPVFLDVPPAVVRHKTDNMFLINMEKVKKWKDALFTAANLSGYDLKNDADESEAGLIKKILKDILPKVNLVNLNVAKEPVGIESRVEVITQLLSTGSTDIQKIGIYGMGGIGKTTIAKALFNKNFRRFDGSCFLANIREASEGHDGILHLQEKLLSEILVVDNFRINNEDRGINLLMERLCSKKVLIVLDDLNDRRQFDCLAGSWNQFDKESMIVITTQYVGLLEQIEVPVDKRYSVKELNEKESLELFSRHAFRKSLPSEEYREVSEGIVRQAGGLPLALVVLGSYLFRRSMGEWRSSLGQLQQIPRHDIQKKLLISYHALGIGNLQDVFLDIACFFIGHDKEMTISILNSCGFDSENNITILMERCLLSVNEKNELRMHDVLREMGRDIAHNNCPGKPWKHSRLWSGQDIFNVLDQKKGESCIKCIIPYGGVLEEEPFRRRIQNDGGPYHVLFETDTFENMHDLRLLSINKVDLTGSFRGIFQELRWLSWRDCPLECLPFDFSPTNLVFLDLRRSNFKILWNGPKRMEQLKILNLSECAVLTTTPDFSGTPCIEDLVLHGCLNMVEIDPSVGHLLSLVKLNLMGCTSLKCLPGSLCSLTALEQLDLDDCSVLEGLPDRLGNMKSLMMLSANNTAIINLPESIGRLKKLSKLSLHRCKKLKYLPSSICNLTAVEFVDFSYCTYLERLPDRIGDMESLNMLGAGGTAITSIPESIGDLSKLSKLLLHSCKKLMYIPSNICNLRALESLDLNNCSNLKELPDNIGNMESLRILWAEGTSITRLPESTGRLSNLVELVLSDCNRLTYFPTSICDLRFLERLDLSDCSSLEGLPDNIGNVISLREFRACHTSFREFPTCVGNLKNLEILVIQFQKGWLVTKPVPIYSELVPPPEFVLRALNLKTLNLSNCHLVDVPDSIYCLLSLKHLNLSGNHFCTLTSRAGNLTNLESLTLTACKSLSAIEELPPNLKDIYAEYCASIEALDVSKLNYLRCMYLSYCTSLVYVTGLEGLEFITWIDMEGCRNLSATFEKILVLVSLLILLPPLKSI